MAQHRERDFPGLQGTAYRITSPPDKVYNCIARAAGDARNWWWPETANLKVYWPPDVPMAETLTAFQAVFASLGYEVCAGAEPDLAFEKIALFADADGCPTHAARQLANGRWTSKLGELEDIEHALHDLEGSAYGLVAQIMKRPRTPAPAAP